MGWARDALVELERGRSVQVCPLGGSMRGRIESGQRVTLAPVTAADVQVGDVIFVRWRSGYLLHLIKEIDGDRFLIGNNVGKINGWVEGKCILGKVTQLHDS